MTNLQKFAAQQLSKPQMNSIKSGYEPDPFDKCGKLFLVEIDGKINYVCEKNTDDVAYFESIGAKFTEV